jgi:hypothetical protein
MKFEIDERPVLMIASGLAEADEGQGEDYIGE